MSPVRQAALRVDGHVGEHECQMTIDTGPCTQVYLQTWQLPPVLISLVSRLPPPPRKMKNFRGSLETRLVLVLMAAHTTLHFRSEKRIEPQPASTVSHRWHVPTHSAQGMDPTSKISEAHTLEVAWYRVCGHSSGSWLEGINSLQCNVHNNTLSLHSFF